MDDRKRIPLVDLRVWHHEVGRWPKVEKRYFKSNNAFYYMNIQHRLVIFEMWPHERCDHARGICEIYPDGKPIQDHYNKKLEISYN